MNLTAKALLALTVAISASAAVATVMALPVQATRFKLTWGVDTYVWTTLPYMLLAILAIAFRRTESGSAISLLGALLIGGLGVFATYNSPDAWGIGLIPIYLLAICGVVLIVQLVRSARTRASHNRP